MQTANRTRWGNLKGVPKMKSIHTYLEIILAAAACMFAVSLYAAEEDVKAGDANTGGEEGMLEEEAVALPPLYTNSFELGLIYPSENSFKFGEYNGLEDSEPHALGNLSILGNNDTLRWNILGTDLGLTSRSVSGSLSKPGSWDLSARYDGLQHNLSDSYRTPGNLDGNHFTLPPDFGGVDGNHPGTDAPFDANSSRTLTATQLADFHKLDIHSDRENMIFGGAYHFNKNLIAKFDYNHLEQTGSKLRSTGTYEVEDLGPTTVDARGESVMIIPEPTVRTTDTFNASLNWQGDKGTLSVGWFGSLFDDKYNSLNFQNAFVNANAPFGGCVGSLCYINNNMSTAPDNIFNQANLNFGYLFSLRTKLAGGFSYGINTQDEQYAPTLIAQQDGTYFNTMLAPLPQLSLDGRVDTIHGDLKLTHRYNKDLMLSATFNYNERDNKTDSTLYHYQAIGLQDRFAANLPFSNEHIQGGASADYRLTRKQKLNLAYEHEYIKRWCDGLPAIAGVVYECVASPSSNEDKVNLKYLVNATDSIKINAGYSFAKRNANFDNTFASNTGSYPVIYANDKMGFHSFMFDSYTKHTGKGRIDWQATDKLDLGVVGSYSSLSFDETLGVQDGHQGSVNLDASYNFSEDSSITAYAGWQNFDRKSLHGQNGDPNTFPTILYTNKLKQDSYALGVNARRGGLMDGKLELLGDFAYSYDTSHFSTDSQDLPGCYDPPSFQCGSAPDITTRLLTLNLNGTYQLNKNGKIRLGYLFQHLNSNDYFYNIYQYGYTPDRVLASSEKAPDYTEHVVFLSYIYEF
jgi:MtrB/PioB family decaheme-associated outer membrane protein